MTAEAPIACTLAEAGLAVRLRDARALGADALAGVRASGREARLRFDGEQERVEALVAAETRCCAFLDFSISRTGGRVDLEIRSPEGGEPALRSLVAAVVAGWEGGL